MGKEDARAKALDQWVERDLSQAAAAGELPRAFQVDDELDRLTKAIASGRNVLVAGPPGVGKTALIHEFVRREASAGTGTLGGRRVVQISLRGRAATLAQRAQLGVELQKLTKHLVASPGVVPFFRDFHLVASYGLAAPMAQLALRCCQPILAEGDGQKIHALFEQEPDVEAEFVQFAVRPPSETRLRAILDAWATDRRGQVHFESDALDAAVSLSNRFLARRGQPRAALELLDAVAWSHGRCTESGVVERFIEAFGVPRLFVDRDYRFDPDALEHRLRATVVEQDEAIDAAMRMILRVRAGVSDPRRPLGAFLLVGPTGVGKTLLAQALAEELFGSRDHMVRINMADYPGQWDAPELFGNAHCDSLAEKRGVLTTRLQGHVAGVLLLDEFEKAHPNVHDRFLQFVDEGLFTNGAGETISCRSLIVIATSNAGAEAYRGNPMGFDYPDPAGVRREVVRRVHEHFRLEFLNRFDEVVYFHPLSRDAVRRIASREIEGLAMRTGLRQRCIALEVDPRVLDWLTEKGYDARYGARYLRRAIERQVATEVAAVLVDPLVGEIDCIHLTMAGGRVVAVPCLGGPPPPRRTSRHGLGSTMDGRKSTIDGWPSPTAAPRA